MIGLIGKKGGMTQIYTENAERIPVTVLEVGPCVVVQRKVGGGGLFEERDWVGGGASVGTGARE